jgi:hypothetical protein
MTWLDLLATAICENPRGIAGVAEQLGVSRTTMSLVVAGKYPAKTDRIAARVLDTYARIACPHLGITITQSQCRAFAGRSAPTNSPRDMRHWRACQGCPLKPTQQPQGGHHA